MTKKKWLKQDLEYAENALKESNEKNRALFQENLALKAEKRNREIADKIAKAIGSGSIYAVSTSLTSQYDGVANLDVTLCGTLDSLYNLGTLLRDGI